VSTHLFSAESISETIHFSQECPTKPSIDFDLLLEYWTKNSPRDLNIYIHRSHHCGLVEREDLQKLQQGSEIFRKCGFVGWLFPNIFGVRRVPILIIYFNW